MTHYHVWFNLKPNVPEDTGLQVVSSYLMQLCKDREASSFQLLRNSGRPPRSKLPAYHALVEFADSDALGAAMKNQSARGIHSGGHGDIIEVVCDFHVEIFSLISDSRDADNFAGCEI